MDLKRENRMATDGPDPPPCEREIFEQGTMVAVVVGVPSNAMERWVSDVRGASGERVDWHFCAGRAIVKVIGDKVTVQHAIMRLASKLPRGASYQLITQPYPGCSQMSAEALAEYRRLHTKVLEARASGDTVAAGVFLDAMDVEWIKMTVEERYRWSEQTGAPQ